MNIRFLTPAQKEVDESVRWYNERADLGRGVRLPPDAYAKAIRIRTPPSRRSKNPPATAGGTDLIANPALL